MDSIFRAGMKAQSLAEIASSWELWRHLTCSEQIALLQSASIQSLPRFHVLFDENEEGTFLHVLFKGRLKVFKTADDEKQVVLYLMRDGETIGERLVDKPGEYGYTAETISDSVVLLLRLDTLRKIIRQNFAFCQAFSGLIFTRLQKAENRMLYYRFNRTEDRVCFFLKEMVEHDSRKLVTGELEIKFLMTQAFIGNMVSVSRQQVTLVLRNLEKRRILKYNRRRLVVFRPDLLCPPNQKEYSLH